MAMTCSPTTPVLTLCAEAQVTIPFAPAAFSPAAVAMICCRPAMSGLAIPTYSKSAMARTSSMIWVIWAVMPFHLVQALALASCRCIVLARICAFSLMPMTISPSKTGSLAAISILSRFVLRMALIGMSTPFSAHRSSQPAVPTLIT